MAKVTHLKTNEAFQLKITLQDVTPQVWRRVIVNSNIKLSDFHKVIQTTMGWTNSHLHQFIKGDDFYAMPDDESLSESIDYRKIRLKDILSAEKESIIYEYDFGDGWEHEIVLEKILHDHPLSHPVCTAGKRNCPPEDCGGPGGFENFLAILADPRHEEYEDIIDWIGGEYDPHNFPIEEINEKL
ncbi:MAG TPA: plasmid pRiA4b ORF-3 family protein, partial [Spirochaetota bacterium]